MMVNLGAVRLLFQPDAAAKKWIPIIDPPLFGLHVGGDVKWSNARCPGSPEVAVTETSSDGGITMHVSGTAAGSCGEFSVYRLAMSLPAYFSGRSTMLWQQRVGN